MVVPEGWPLIDCMQNSYFTRGKSLIDCLPADSLRYFIFTGSTAWFLIFAE
jgi:hypothetical protein